MSNSPLTPGVVPNRLPQAALAENFADHAPPLDMHEARVAADRCYFCHDAPCMTACPTSIDIPLFIRQIATGTPEAAAKTILAQNIMGGMCARVCPTETLCEEVCVREVAEGKPVEIGYAEAVLTVLAEAIELAGLHGSDPHAAAVAASNNLVSAVSASLIAATGGWSEAAQNASDLIASVKDLDFKSIAEAAVEQRGRLTGEIDV